ncbi:MAG: phytanoyl-CoA dioxygenase family protein [Phycisphaeraceae bacterium]|nr:phytanoyl-CoA dioxygenase family protein [Phycisphaeraceae bacterium]
MPLTDTQIANYHRDGFVIVPDLFTAEEIDLIGRAARQDPRIVGATGVEDTAGKQSKIWITDQLGDDIYSTIARCRRVMGNAGALLDGPAIHFHHKMMCKEPQVGGAWEWHQDYGYWYRNERFLFPDLISCMIAVDRAHPGNGCLRVIPGSHLAGRIEHGTVAGQVGADVARVEAIKQRLGVIDVELDPGAGLFFHSNTLHSSSANESDDPRWAYICCYTREDNLPLGRARKDEPASLEQLKAYGQQWLKDHDSTILDDDRVLTDARAEVEKTAAAG